MEVKIGVLHSTRELSVESDETQEQVEAAVAAAGSDGVLRLSDVNGTRILVPAVNLAYIEIGAARRGGVGFGSL